MPVNRRVVDDPTPVMVHSEEVGDEESLEVPVVKGEAAELDAYARQLAFEAEEIEIMLLPQTGNPDDTTRLEMISINDKPFHFIRGQWRKAPRYVLAAIVNSRPRSWNFGYRTLPTGDTVQTQDSFEACRFQYQFRDTNPEGVKWHDAMTAALNKR